VRETAIQLARYVATGGAAAIVDIGGFAILHHLGAAIVIAATLSFCAAAVINYALTARFVFAAGPSPRGFGLFLAFALVGLAINVGTTMLVSTRAQLPPETAKICGVAVAFLANFTMNRMFVFGRQ
jgi:putative flippase GtrA